MVVVGLDGLSFRVLAPMMAAGELPTFQRLVDEGAWGTCLTYGTASSPRVWTSLATGKKVRDHGIDDFVAVAGAGYRPRPLGRRDWRARPLWDLLGDRGRRVAVVDWLSSHPAQPVNGRIVTRLNDRAVAAWPAAARDEVAAILAARPLPDDDTERGLVAVDRAFAVAAAWLDHDTDFLALYTAALDSAEHHGWRGFRPGDFDPDRWGPPPADPGRSELIPALHRRVDQRLGELVARLEPSDLLVVVSDHGQLAAARPRVDFRADRLLAALGWAELDPSGRVDPARSRVYPLATTAWVPNLRINVNRVGREASGVVAASAAPALAAEVASTLAALRLDDGAPLFARVDHLGADGGPVDVQVVHSLATWSDRSLDRAVVVGDRRLVLADLLAVSTELTGDHDHQGVLIFHGAGVRPGPIGPRTTLTAAHHILHHLTDKVDAVDRLLPPLRRLGLIEAATTLDLTPTVLHALALPVGRDMAGRALTEVVHVAHPLAWVDSWERPAAPTGGEAPAADGDDEVLERLRSLGYVQ